MSCINRILSAGAALLFACNAASAASNLRIGINDDPDLLDPTLSRAYTARLVLTAFCDKLFDITPDLKIIPQLATEYQWAPDNMALTIKLRPNVKFHDGEPFDAEAAKFNFERNAALPGSYRKSELGAVESVTIVDPMTVRLNLKEPQAPLIATIADRAGMMVSPKAAREMGDKLGTKPVCAGPYRFVERVAQGRIVFQKFADYWNKDSVHIDQVEFVPVTDSTVRLSNLASGEFDMIERVSPTDLAQIRSNPKLRVVGAPDIGYAYWIFNVGNGPRGKLLADQRLREAIDLSIDRQTLVQVVFENEFLPGSQWVAPSSAYYNKDLPVPKRDVVRAKALLKEAGQPNLTFKLIVPPERDRQTAAQVMQAMLAESGINMIIDTQENVTMLKAGEEGNFDAFFSFWSGRVDPDGNTHNYNTCKGSLNFSKYCNPALDKALNEARRVVDPAQRKKYYDEAAAIWLKDRPMIALWYRNVFIAHNVRVQGFTPYPDGIIRLVGLKVQ
jgi:peptide/nickel transport system substrate-binding protein